MVDRGWPETGLVTGHGATPVFASVRFPREVISPAVRWSLRYGRSYRDVEEPLAGRGLAVDHVTSYRRVPRCTPEFIEAARPCRPAPGDRWPAGQTQWIRAAGHAFGPNPRRGHHDIAADVPRRHTLRAASDGLAPAI